MRQSVKPLAAYIDEANAKAAALHLESFHDRLSAFQNSDVRSDRGDYYDNFLDILILTRLTRRVISSKCRK